MLKKQSFNETDADLNDNRVDPEKETLLITPASKNSEIVNGRIPPAEHGYHGKELFPEADSIIKRESNSKADVEENYIDWSKGFVLPQRVILSIMGFFAVFIAFAMRSCLSMAITRIAKSHHRSKISHEGEMVCPGSIHNLNSTKPIEFEYEWSEQLQGFILASFYIGYLIFHLPGGILAEKFGGKWVLSLGILSIASFTLITPFVIHQWGAGGLIVVRILMGLGAGTTYPAICALLSAWVPAKERSRLGSLVLGGGQAGAMLGNLISGVIMENHSWKHVFHIFGAAGLIWFVIFTLLCYSNPESHPFIKPREKEYLRREMGSIENKTNLPPTPWLAIMTNIPMLASTCAQIGHDWGVYILMSHLPKYMDNVLRFSIKANGFFSSIPLVARWIVSICSGYISDHLINKGILSITTSRKVFTIISSVGAAVFLVAASYAGCDKIIFVVIFTIGSCFKGTFVAGVRLSPLDLSPNYSGSLMAITNGIGSITGIVAPYVAGAMTPNATISEWRLVFWVSFGVLVSTSTVYGIFASGEVQPFNEPKDLKEIETEAGANRTEVNKKEKS